MGSVAGPPLPDASYGVPDVVGTDGEHDDNADDGDLCHADPEHRTSRPGWCTANVALSVGGSSGLQGAPALDDTKTALDFHGTQTGAVLDPNPPPCACP